MWRTSFLSSTEVGSQSFTSAARWTFWGGGVVLGDGGNAAHAVTDGLPGIGHIVAQGIHGPHAGNDDSAFFHS